MQITRSIDFSSVWKVWKRRKRKERREKKKFLTAVNSLEGCFSVWQNLIRLLLCGLCSSHKNISRISHWIFSLINFLDEKYVLKVYPIIYSNSFNFFSLYRRQHLNNWSMTKENRDPIGVLATDVPSNGTMKLSAHKNHTLDKGRMPNSPKTSSLNNATDLFELLERCQSQRLDDQRCVLPSYFSQVSWTVTVSRQTAALFLIPSRPPFSLFRILLRFHTSFSYGSFTFGYLDSLRHMTQIVIQAKIPFPR